MKNKISTRCCSCLIVITILCLTSCEPFGSKDSDNSSASSTSTENSSSPSTTAPTTPTATEYQPNTSTKNQNASASVSYNRQANGFYTLTLHVVGADAGTRLLVGPSTGIDTIIPSNGEYHHNLNGDYFSGPWSFFVILRPYTGNTYSTSPPDRTIRIDVNLP